MVGRDEVIDVMNRLFKLEHTALSKYTKKTAVDARYMIAELYALYTKLELEKERSKR